MLNSEASLGEVTRVRLTTTTRRDGFYEVRGRGHLFQVEHWEGAWRVRECFGPSWSPPDRFPSKAQAVDHCEAVVATTSPITGEPCGRCRASRHGACVCPPPSPGDLSWELTEEVPYDDGTPTGRFFVQLHRWTDDGFGDGWETADEHVADARGPYRRVAALRVRRGLNARLARRSSQ